MSLPKDDETNDGSRVLVLRDVASPCADPMQRGGRVSLKEKIKLELSAILDRLMPDEPAGGGQAKRQGESVPSSSRRPGEDRKIIPITQEAIRSARLDEAVEGRNPIPLTDAVLCLSEDDRIHRGDGRPEPLLLSASNSQELARPSPLDPTPLSLTERDRLLVLDKQSEVRPGPVGRISDATTAGLRKRTSRAEIRRKIRDIVSRLDRVSGTSRSEENLSEVSSRTVPEPRPPVALMGEAYADAPRGQVRGVQSHLAEQPAVSAPDLKACDTIDAFRPDGFRSTDKVDFAVTNRDVPGAYAVPKEHRPRERMEVMQLGNRPGKSGPAPQKGRETAFVPSFPTAGTGVLGAVGPGIDGVENLQLSSVPLGNPSFSSREQKENVAVSVATRHRATRIRRRPREAGRDRIEPYSGRVRKRVLETSLSTLASGPELSTNRVLRGSSPSARPAAALGADFVSLSREVQRGIQHIGENLRRAYTEEQNARGSSGPRPSVGVALSDRGLGPLRSTLADSENLDSRPTVCISASAVPADAPSDLEGTGAEHQQESARIGERSHDAGVGDVSACLVDSGNVLKEEEKQEVVADRDLSPPPPPEKTVVRQADQPQARAVFQERSQHGGVRAAGQRFSLDPGAVRPGAVAAEPVRLHPRWQGDDIQSEKDLRRFLRESGGHSPVSQTTVSAVESGPLDDDGNTSLKSQRSLLLGTLASVFQSIASALRDVSGGYSSASPERYDPKDDWQHERRPGMRRRLEERFGGGSIRNADDRSLFGNFRLAPLRRRRFEEEFRPSSRRGRDTLSGRTFRHPNRWNRRRRTSDDKSTINFGELRGMERNDVRGQKSESVVERVIRSTVESMVYEWLDANLSSITEKIVEREVRSFIDRNQ